MRRSNICLCLGPAARAELQAPIANRNTARKLIWRAATVLATADGHGTFEIMRRALTSTAACLAHYPAAAKSSPTARRDPDQVFDPVVVTLDAAFGQSLLDTSEAAPIRKTSPAKSTITGTRCRHA